MIRDRNPERVLRAHVALGGLAQALVGVAGALLAEDLGGSAVFAGLPQTLLVVGAAVSALPLSAAAERAGRGWSLTVGGLAGTAGCIVTLLGAALGTLWGVVLGSLLLGTGNVSVMLARYAGPELRPDLDRGRAVAGVLTATTVGAVLGPNLLAASPRVANLAGLPELAGAYVLGGTAYLLAAVVGLALRRDLPPTCLAPDRAVAPDRLLPAALGVHPTPLLGAVTLAVSNLVMVGVMTMAPPHLHHRGVPLSVVGLVVSLHIAGMFAPSPVSGLLVRRVGARLSAIVAAVILVGACTLAAVVDDVLPFGAAMVLLGTGWNVSLVAGSVLLTTGTTTAQRPRREALGEIGAAVAAAGAGIGSGSLFVAGGYSTLAAAGCGCAIVLGALLVSAPARARASTDVPTRACIHRRPDQRARGSMTVRRLRGTITHR